MAEILVTGGSGMLGRALVRALGARAVGVGHAGCDLTRPDSIAAALAAHRPRLVINCAAMTRVDACEQERDLAFAVNATGAGALARACAAGGVRLIHLSTDYIFAGTLDRPYREDDPTGPRTVYGQSKLAGEEAVLAAGGEPLVLRIAWLYGPGGPSFLHSMMRLAAQPGPPVQVVDDQRGNPTSTLAVVGHLRLLLDRPVAGILHLTCEGETTWYGFARELFALRGWTRGVAPCTTAEFPRPAPRPANSSLEKHRLHRLGLPPMPGWRDALRDFLAAWPEG